MDSDLHFILLLKCIYVIFRYLLHMKKIYCGIHLIRFTPLTFRVIILLILVLINIFLIDLNNSKHVAWERSYICLLAMHDISDQEM